MFPSNNLFNKPLWDNGPFPGDFYNFPGRSNEMSRQSIFNGTMDMGRQHSA